MSTLHQKLKEAREKAAKALHEARQLQERHKDEAMPPEVNTQFDAFIAEHCAAKTEAEALQGQINSREQLDAHERAFNAPVPSVPGRGVERPSEEQAANRNRRHNEAFHRYLRGGPTALRPEEVQEFWVSPSETHALSSVVGELGGFLAPPDFRAEVVRDLPGFAVIRPLARVEPTGGNVLQLPSVKPATSNPNIYSSGYTGAWKPENYVTGGTAPSTQDAPKFGLESIPVHIWQPNAVEIPITLLQDSKADVNGILAEIIAETWGLDEDAGFINGSGVGQPLGILNTTTISTVNSGSSGNITYNGLVDLYSNLPAQYRRNATILTSSLGYAQILKLQDDDHRPLYPPGTDVEQFLKKPFAFSEFVTAPAAAAKAVVIGDFRYYGIADREELRIQRLNEVYAPNVGVLAMARVGGQVLRANAFRIQVLS